MESILIRAALKEDDGMSLMNEGKFADARMYYDKKLQELNSRFWKDQFECLEMKEKLGWSMFEMGSFFEAKELLEEVVREGEIILGDSHPQCIRLYMLISVIIKNVGKKSQGDVLYKKLSKILDKIDKSKNDFTLSCLQIAISYVNLCRNTEAEGILKGLLREQKNSCLKKIPLSLVTKVVIGHNLLEAGKFSEAKAYLEDILRSNSDLSEIEPNLYYLCNRATVLYYIGMDKFFEAQTQLDKISRLQTVRLGNTYVHRLNILRIIAECSFQQDMHEEAKRLFEDVLRIEADTYGKESFFYLQTCLRICETIIYLGNFSEAKSFLEELSRNIALAFGEGNQIFLQVLGLKARLKMGMGEKKEAAVTLKDLLFKQLDIVGEYHSHYLKSKQMLTEVHFTNCEFSESLESCEDFLRLQSLKYGDDHQECFKTKMHIAEIYMKMKRFAESETLLKEVVKSLKEKFGEDKYTIDATGLLAMIFFHLGKKEEGLTLLETYIRKMEVTRRNLDLTLTISSSLMEVNEWEYLKSVLKNCLRHFIEILGNDHVKTIDCQVKLAYCLIKLKRSAEAREVIYKVLAELPNVYAQNDASSLEVIAYVLTELCEYEKAIVLLNDAIVLLNDTNVLLNEVLKSYEEGGNDCKALSTIIMITISLSKICKNSKMRCIVLYCIIVKHGLIRLSEVDFKDDPSYINVAVDFMPLGLSCEYHTRMINLCQKLLSLPRNIFGENHASYLMVLEGLGLSFMNSGESIKAKNIYLKLLKKTKEIHGEGHEEFRRIKEQFLSFQNPE